MIYFITFISVWLIIWLALGIYFFKNKHQHISFGVTIALGFISLGVAMTIAMIIAIIIAIIIGSGYFYYFLCR